MFRLKRVKIRFINWPCSDCSHKLNYNPISLSSILYSETRNLWRFHLGLYGIPCLQFVNHVLRPNERNQSRKIQHSTTNYPNWPLFDEPSRVHSWAVYHGKVSNNTSHEVCMQLHDFHTWILFLQPRLCVHCVHCGVTPKASHVYMIIINWVAEVRTKVFFYPWAVHCEGSVAFKSREEAFICASKKVKDEIRILNKMLQRVILWRRPHSINIVRSGASKPRCCTWYVCSPPLMILAKGNYVEHYDTHFEGIYA